MKNKTKISKKSRIPALRAVLVSLLAAAVSAGAVFSHFGGFGTGECADVQEFAKYAQTVGDITVPEQTRIISLGEATHGNAEFQQLKLDVFKVTVEKYGVRAFTLEGDFGGCEAVNRYIQGGEGTAREAAAAIGFTIYRTEQMEQLIEWMREYNKTASGSDTLRFYGFDMQRYDYDYIYLLEAAAKAGADTTELEKLWDDESGGFSDAYDTDARAEVIEDIKAQLLGLSGADTSNDPYDTAYAAHFADILLQNIEIGKLAETLSEGKILRDKLMAENVMWILGQEEARGNSRIFVSAHNGHIEQDGSYTAKDKVMGTILAENVGKDCYYAIGTDFYRSDCALPSNGGGRKTHVFYSYDPLAKASRKCGNDICWLDFSSIPEDSPLKAQTDYYTWMGCVGDGYSPLMAVLPMSYRVWRSPSRIYDSMIFVSYAHPIEVKELV